MYSAGIMDGSAQQSAPSLALRGVSRAFGERAVLHDVSWERSTAGVVGITGPNGCGKTTLVRVIAQLVEADTGTIDVCGHAYGAGAVSEHARRCVGYAAHRPLARSMRTVRANLLHAAALRGLSRSQRPAEVDRVIGEWDASGLADQMVARLSRGQQQRYALAMADLGAPRVLLLDEPTVGLDDVARGDLEQAMDRWRGDRIVVVTSHEHDWLSAHADELVHLVGAGSHE